MRYPDFYDRFLDAIRNTWTVEDVDLRSDLADLDKFSPAERHLVHRLVAFFATGDTIVANNLVPTWSTPPSKPTSARCSPALSRPRQRSPKTCSPAGWPG